MGTYAGLLRPSMNRQQTTRSLSWYTAGTLLRAIHATIVACDPGSTLTRCLSLCTCCPSGSVVDTPVVPWLLDLAAAQRGAQQPSAAVASLQKALEYMALPSQQEGDQGSSSSSSSPQALQQQGASIPVPPGSSGSSSGVGGEGGEGVDTLTAVMAAAGGNAELARLKLGAMVSGHFGVVFGFECV